MSKGSKTMRATADEKKLLDAARRCEEAVIEQLAKSRKVNLNVSDENGSTAVHFCSKAANLSSLAILLEHGARTHATDHRGMAPIHYAASKDYIDTMALLVAYEGNPNLRNTKDGKTALHYACEGNRRHAVKFLIFCGADSSLKDNTGRCPNLSGLHVEETMEIKQAFKDGLIKTFGKMIHKAEERTFSSTRFAINNTDKDSKEFSFFCRTMSVESLRLDAASRSQLLKHLEAPDLEAASDAYEYIVNQRVVDVMVTIPIFSSPNEFDNVVVIDSKDNEYKCIEIKQTEEGAFISARVAFEVDEENVMSMVAVKKLKTDVHVVTGQAQTMTSSIEEEFVLFLPEKCLPKDSNVELKILPTKDFYNTLNTEHVQNISNFYNIQLDHKVRKPIQIRLPNPANYDERSEQSEVVVFNARIIEDHDWKRVDAEVASEGRAVNVTDKSANTGTYIVAEVTKKQTKSASDWLKGFLKWLHSLVFTRTKSCCFIAMTKHVTDTRYRLMVLLSEESRSNATERTWSKEDYITQTSQKTQSYLCKPGQSFTVEVDNTDSISIRGRSFFDLVFRSGKDNRQEFVVTGKEYDIAIVCISKREKDGTLSDEERVNRNIMTQINVELLKKIPGETQSTEHRFAVILHEGIEGAPCTVKWLGNPRTSGTYKYKYPDDRFLHWLSGEIGHEWLMVGIGVGMSYSFLERIERDNRRDARRMNLTMLVAWRIDNDGHLDHGIGVLLHSLNGAGRIDLVKQINSQVEQLLETSPEERLCKLLKPTIRQSGEYFLDCLVADIQAASPFHERFLVTIATTIQYDVYVLQQLNVPQDHIDALRTDVSNPTAAMLKCLLIARRLYKDECVFFKDLMNALRSVGNNLAISEIKTQCLHGLRYSASQIESRQKRLKDLLNQ